MAADDGLPAGADDAYPLAPFAPLVGVAPLRIARHRPDHPLVEHARRAAPWIDRAIWAAMIVAASAIIGRVAWALIERGTGL